MTIDEIRAALSLAEEHVTRGKGAIERQLEVIATLDESGSEIALARSLLETFETVQVKFVADRDRLLRELRAAQG